MLRLELDSGQAIDLDDLRDDDGTALCHITEADFGYPDVREISEPRPQASGTVDRTRHFGARAIQLTGKLAIDWEGRARRQAFANALAPFLVPSARPWLYANFDDGSIKRIRLRPDDYSSPQIANVRDVSISFKSPTGVLESQDEQSVSAVPEIQAAGRTYNLSHNRVYPEADSPDARAYNAGSIPADWVARVFGPCHGPDVLNLTTDEGIYTRQGLQVARGDFVEFNSAAHTVLMNGERTASRWQYLNYGNTTWWQLPPGESIVRFRCEWWESPARMLFYWRNSYLL